MTTIHEQRAAEQARSPVSAFARTIGRQGDVVLVRLGEPADAHHSPTPDGGVLIAAGQHGEHRLVGDSVAWLGDGKVSVLGGPVLLHTDVPADRHGPFRLSDGTWAYYREREMGAEDIAVEVRD